MMLADVWGGGRQREQERALIAKVLETEAMVTAFQPIVGLQASTVWGGGVDTFSRNR